MKKQVALALAAALSLSVAGTALAAPANPFVDVPANHWAYDAIKDLQKDGVVSGYGDGTFRGDRTLTRYEMAAMIAKISDTEGKHEALIKKLQSEFATELYNLGVRVDALEKNASTIKFTGDARIRYQPNTGLVLDSASNTPSRFQNRVRINAVADINEKTKFIGRMKWESNSNSDSGGNPDHNSDTRNLYFDRAEFAYTNGDFGVSAGRLLPTIGQGLIISAARADGALLKYNPGNFTIAAGYLDVATTLDGNAGRTGLGAATMIGGTPNVDTGSINAFVAHMGYNFNDRANLTLGYMDGTSNTSDYTNNHGSDGGLKLWSVGTTVKLGKDWAFVGEYAKNQDAPDVNNGDDAYLLRLKYGNSSMNKVGSYYIYADYMNFGGDSILGQGSDGMFGGAPAQWGVTGGFIGSNGLGAKGWSLGTEYVYAKNMSLSVAYFDLKTKERNGSQDYKGMWTIENNFRF